MTKETLAKLVTSLAFVLFVVALKIDASTAAGEIKQLVEKLKAQEEE